MVTSGQIQAAQRIFLYLYMNQLCILRQIQAPDHIGICDQSLQVRTVFQIQSGQRIPAVCLLIGAAQILQIRAAAHIQHWDAIASAIQILQVRKRSKDQNIFKLFLVGDLFSQEVAIDIYFFQRSAAGQIQLGQFIVMQNQFFQRSTLLWHINF